MAIKTTDGGTMVTDEHTRLYQEMVIASALASEITHNIKMARGSVVQAANRITGSTKRTKRGALRDLTLWSLVTWTGYKGSDRVIEAMGGAVTYDKLVRKAAKFRAVCEREQLDSETASDLWMRLVEANK